jgi:hypothetical protein
MDVIHKLLVPTDPLLGPRAMVSTVCFTTAGRKLVTLSKASGKEKSPFPTKGGQQMPVDVPTNHPTGPARRAAPVGECR